jgi:hypothetical protein
MRRPTKRITRTQAVSLLTFLALTSLAGCSEKEATSAKAECVSPTNPFNDGGGHDAGFNWAEEKGEECPDSHGESFEEGCQEFHRQFQEYEQCQAEKRK